MRISLALIMLFLSNPAMADCIVELRISGEAVRVDLREFTQPDLNPSYKTVPEITQLVPNYQLALYLTKVEQNNGALKLNRYGPYSPEQGKELTGFVDNVKANYGDRFCK
jgi:hypothetical protein